MKELRLFIMINTHRSEHYFPLTPKEITDHLEHPVDVVLPYSRHAAGMLLQGKRLYKHNAMLSSAFTDISQLLNGKLLDGRKNKSVMKNVINWIKR